MKHKIQKISFDEYYNNMYKDRWQKLKEAFLKEKDQVNLSEELLKPYYLDPASKLVAGALPIEQGDTVLDMCAAPGGKTLSIALRLKGTGTLISNDRSPERRIRLKNVVNESLKEEWRNNIIVKGYDASSWCLYEKDAYDKILLDAPCSSERHVFNDQKHLALWSENRPKRLAKEQFALLSSALICLKKGGCLLYSTCSINKGENEEVIERLFKRHSDEIEEIEVDLKQSEKLTRGCIILPDISDGLGPMYCCLIKKK